MKIRAGATRLNAPDSRRVKPPLKTADPFYLSPPWRELVTHLMRERGKACQHCGRGNTRIYGDHIREIRDGGALLDPENVQLLCGSCHVKVTVERRAARLAERPVSTMGTGLFP